MLSIVARTRSVETVTCWLATGADAAGAAATGEAAEGVVGMAGVAVRGSPLPGTGVGAGDGKAGAATRAGGGPNIDGWPLCRFHDSQMKNSEARKMPHSKVRRMSVMASIRKTRAAVRPRVARARAGR